MSLADLIYEEVKALPEQLAREVLDFASYLRDRQTRADWRDLQAAQSRALQDVWNTSEDSVWDNA